MSIPMSTPTGTLVLAAHGAGDASPANQQVREIAYRLRQVSSFRRVEPAFRLGRPSFATALRGLGPETAVVVPLLTSRGYFYNRVLAHEVNRYRLPGVGPRILTAPLGEHPRLLELAQERILEAWRRLGCETGSTVIVIGHGTRRHPQSGDTTRALADSLKDRLQSRLPHRSSKVQVEPAFLDASPGLEGVVAAHGAGPLVALPFLFGGGGHTDRDIPQCLEKHLGPSGRAPRQTPWAVTAPLGESKVLEELVLDLAEKAVLSRSSHSPSAAAPHLPEAPVSLREANETAGFERMPQARTVPKQAPSKGVAHG